MILESQHHSELALRFHERFLNPTYTIVVEKDVAATTKHLYHTGQVLGFSVSGAFHVTSKLGSRLVARPSDKTQTSAFCISDILETSGLYLVDPLG